MIQQPSSIIVAGPSGSGKTVLIKSLLRNPRRLFAERPKKIVYAYDRWQPPFEDMKRRDGIPFSKGIPEQTHLTKWFDQKGGILILDDLMKEGGQEKRVLDLFT